MRLNMLHIRRIPGILFGHVIKHYYATLSVLLLLITSFYYLIHWGIVCTNIQTWQHVISLCQQYHNEEAIGNLCKPLCNDRQIRSLKCHAFSAHKEAIFSAEWEDTKLVFKSSNIIKTVGLDNLLALNRPHAVVEKNFEKMISDYVATKLNQTLSNDQIKRLGRLGFSKAKEGEMRKLEMKNTWQLLQNREYLYSVLFSDRDVFPQLLGTCGNYFAVEYLYPLSESVDIFSFSDNHQEWTSRIKLAVMMLEFLDELDSNFQEPFHLCDVKFNHFGLAKSGQRLKILDIDAVLPKSIASNLTASGKHCSQHDECDFMDCRSLCNWKTRRCDLPITNSNFQIICEKIFLGWTMSGSVILPGLLMSQYTPPPLASILRLCANPDTIPGKPRAAVSDDIKRRLYTTLTEMELYYNSE